MHGTDEGQLKPVGAIRIFFLTSGRGRRRGCCCHRCLRRQRRHRRHRRQRRRRDGGIGGLFLGALPFQGRQKKTLGGFGVSRLYGQMQRRVSVRIRRRQVRTSVGRQSADDVGGATDASCGRSGGRRRRG